MFYTNCMDRPHSLRKNTQFRLCSPPGCKQLWEQWLRVMGMMGMESRELPGCLFLKVPKLLPGPSLRQPNVISICFPSSPSLLLLLSIESRALSNIQLGHTGLFRGGDFNECWFSVLNDNLSFPTSTPILFFLTLSSPGQQRQIMLQHKWESADQSILLLHMKQRVKKLERKKDYARDWER